MILSSFDLVQEFGLGACAPDIYLLWWVWSGDKSSTGLSSYVYVYNGLMLDLRHMLAMPNMLNDHITLIAYIYIYIYIYMRYVLDVTHM